MTGRRGTASQSIALVLAAAFALAACGAGSAAPPRIAPDLLPGSPGDPLVLDASALAEQAVHPDRLEELLQSAGFVVGSERTFSAPRPARRALARVLVFDSAAGAEEYLAWVRENAGELVGEVAEQTPLELPGEPFLLLHEPGGCCPKERDNFVTAWRRGSTVLYLEVTGDDVRREDVTDLASILDAAV